MACCAYNIAFKNLHVKIPGHMPLTTRDLDHLLQISEHLQFTLDIQAWWEKVRKGWEKESSSLVT